MMPPVIASVVEGHGEVAALRPLIYNIIASSGGVVYPKIMLSYRAHWGSMVNIPGELERYSEIAIREGGPTARLLVLLDADDRCPAELGAELTQRLAVRFPNNPVSVNVANWEYESWFIASAESIAAHFDADLPCGIPQDIEAFGGQTKHWLGQNIIGGRYKETEHQAAFSNLINVPLARQRSHSFNRFCREVARLLSA